MKRYDILYAKEDKLWFDWIFQTMEATGEFTYTPNKFGVLETIHANHLEFVLFLVSKSSVRYRDDAFMPDWTKYYAKDPTGLNHFFIPLKVEPVDTTHLFQPIKPIKLYEMSDINEVHSTLMRAVSTTHSKEVTAPFPGRRTAFVPGEVVQPGRDKSSVDPSELGSHIHPNDGMTGVCDTCGAMVRYRKGKTTYKVWFSVPDRNEDQKQVGWIITCPIDDGDVKISLPGIGRRYF